jgi:hypothetical protein
MIPEGRVSHARFVPGLDLYVPVDSLAKGSHRARHVSEPAMVSEKLPVREAALTLTEVVDWSSGLNDKWRRKHRSTKWDRKGKTLSTSVEDLHRSSILPSRQTAETQECYQRRAVVRKDEMLFAPSKLGEPAIQNP